MSWIVFLVFGFVIGLLARALLPGPQSLSMMRTAVLGSIGSFLGGVLGNMISGQAIVQLQPAGMLGSVLGAIIVLGATSFTGRRFSP